MGFGKDNKGAMWIEGNIITLGTLAANTALKADTQIVLGDDARILAMEGVVHSINMTADEGPVLVGICNNELTVAEIAEALVIDGPTDRNDRDLTEKVERAVFPMFSVSESGIVPIGKFDNVESVTGVGGSAVQCGYRRPLRWTFSNPEGWTWFAFNFSGSALTTAGIVRLFTKYFGVWVT